MAVSQRTMRLSAMGAMAVLWAFFFNARLFPVSLTAASDGSLMSLPLYLVYGLSLAIASALAVFLESLPAAALYRRFWALAGCGIGLSGALLVVFPYGDFAAASLAVGLGTGCMAVFLVAQFWFWTATLRSREPVTALTDAAVGLAIFCACSAPAALLHAEWPIAFAVLPLISFVCTFITPKQTAASLGDLGKPIPSSDESASGQKSSSDHLSRRLIRRALVPSVVYLYLVQAMNVSLDMVMLLPIAAFRPWVFVFVVVAVAVVVCILRTPRLSPVKRLVGAFNTVSACLLIAFFVTCCQVVGFLPIGNYAVVAAKMLLYFFIWTLLLLRPSVKAPAGRCVVLLALYLVFILWLPNLLQSVVLAVVPMVEAPDQLSWLFIGLSAITLAISVGSSAVVSSLVPDKAPVTAPAQSATWSQGVMNNTLDEVFDTRSSLIGQPGDSTTEEVNKPARTLEAFQVRYGLSDREVEITRMACEGKTAKRMARDLFIAESTVYTHLKHIYRKVGVHSKQELVDVAETYGQ